ncbi:MAG: hypothetical protein NTZ07_00655 [Candidatus Woesebacteria bacterium]|nr:hypothetical protein [Candidatus Woesebacteria bacterium]
MSAKKVNRAAKQLLIFAAALFILLLASVNIKNYLAPKKVLGTKIRVDATEKFWQDFLARSPNYIPGWIEIGRIDKVKEIDPNYITP